MIWINPVADVGWYCDTTPIPAAIWYIQGVYTIGTPFGSQQTDTLEKAFQLGHDMVLAESVIVKGLSFRAFSLDAPDDGQSIYVIDVDGVITTGAYSDGTQTVTQLLWGTSIAVASLTGWCAMG